MIEATESSLYQFISFELINTKTKKKREETALDLYSFMKGIWRVIEGVICVTRTLIHLIEV